MDPPYRTLEGTVAFASRFEGRGCSRWTITDDYGRIRRAHRDGMSIREMARTFHHSRHKIRKILHGGQAEPAKYARRGSQSAPKLGQFHDRILEILKLDEAAPPKQRHTAMRIFERLRDEHDYAGGYNPIGTADW